VSCRQRSHPSPDIAWGYASETGGVMAPINPTTSILELRIADVHTRFAQGVRTCTELTQHFL